MKTAYFIVLTILTLCSPLKAADIVLKAKKGTKEANLVSFINAGYLQPGRHLLIIEPKGYLTVVNPDTENSYSITNLDSESYSYVYFSKGSIFLTQGKVRIRLEYTREGSILWRPYKEIFLEVPESSDFQLNKNPLDLLSL